MRQKRLTTYLIESVDQLYIYIFNICIYMEIS